MVVGARIHAVGLCEQVEALPVEACLHLPPRVRRQELLVRLHIDIAAAVVFLFDDVHHPVIVGVQSRGVFVVLHAHDVLGPDFPEFIRTDLPSVHQHGKARVVNRGYAAAEQVHVERGYHHVEEQPHGVVCAVELLACGQIDHSVVLQEPRPALHGHPFQHPSEFGHRDVLPYLPVAAHDDAQVLRLVAEVAEAYGDGVGRLERHAVPSLAVCPALILPASRVDEY